MTDTLEEKPSIFANLTVQVLIGAALGILVALYIPLGEAATAEEAEERASLPALSWKRSKCKCVGQESDDWRWTRICGGRGRTACERLRWTKLV